MDVSVDQLSITNMLLIDLPLEVKILIIAPLGYASKVALSLTNRSFNTLLRFSPFNLPHVRYDDDDLLAIERWPVYDRAGSYATEGHTRQPLTGGDYFACCGCSKIRDAVHFTNAMMKGKKGKHGSRTEARTRFCIDCMVKLGMSKETGTTVGFGGALINDRAGGGNGIFCHRCRGFKRVRADYRKRDSCDDCKSLLS